MAQLSPDLVSRLKAVRKTGGFSEETLSTFRNYLAEAPDEDLHRASPLLYAAATGSGEQEAIDLFLHATHAGVLEFSWGILCPACVSFLTTPGGLKALAEDRRCGFCQIPVSGSLDDNVEVAFTVSPTVRRIRFHDHGSIDVRSDGSHIFFSPSLAPDAMLRQLFQGDILWAGHVVCNEPLEVKAELAPGRYVLLAPASHSVLHLDAVEGGPASVDVDIVDGHAIPERTTIASGSPTLRVNCRMPRGAGLLLFPDPVPPPEEREGYAPPSHNLQPYLTGKRLLTTQAFRDLFSAASIPSEGGLELKSLTVLFTDLKSSTEMYERVGDFQAFGAVRRHFVSLREAVAEQGGAIVKTIGDAIMASFPEPGRAMAAAAVMDREVAALEGNLALKIGLHAGPCIAVELNNRLDYFGRTVNIAARVQGLAGAREIVCTDPVWNAPGVEEASREAGLFHKRDAATLKGIQGDMPVVRLRA